MHTGPAIEAPFYKTSGMSSDGGAVISLLDSVIECNGNADAPAVSSGSSLYINSLWTSGCATIVQQPASRFASIRIGAKQPALHWSVVHELARGVDIPAARPGNLVMDVTYDDSVRKAKGVVENVSASVTPPPVELLRQHVLWDQADFPSFESPTTVNAVASCGVKGDGETDDEPALSACLKAHRDVFLPKGYYRLGRTLELNPHNRLVGLAQTLTVLMPLSAGFGELGNETGPQPLVRTAAGSPATLAFLGINTWWHLGNLFTVDWRARGGLWRANYDSRVCECLWLANYRPPTTPCTPAVRLSVPKVVIRGTGNFVNFVNDEDILMTDHVQYRHVQVIGAGDPHNSSDRVRFYELNLEHAQSQANLEVVNSSGVDIYGVKLEGSTTILWVRDSDDVNLWGLGGAGDSFPGSPADWKGAFRGSKYDFKIPSDVPRYNASTVRIERTLRYRLVNLYNGDRGQEGGPISQIHPVPLTPKMLSGFKWPADDLPKMIDPAQGGEWTPWPGWQIPPSLWSVVGEMDGVSDTAARLTTPLDRPVLMRRGYSDSQSQMKSDDRSAAAVGLLPIMLRLQTTGERVMVDSFGRERAFHGTNAVVKGPPWIPSRGAFDQFTSLTAKDFELMQSAGVNAIRLGVMWPGVEPVRGQ